MRCFPCNKKKFKEDDRVTGNNEYRRLFNGDRMFHGVILELDTRPDCGEIATICVNGEKRHINTCLLELDDRCCPLLAKRIFGCGCKR